jgi:hypothetical protein
VMSAGEQFVDYLKEQSASNNDVAVGGVVAREASIPQVTDQFAPPPGQYYAPPVLNQGPAPSQLLFFSSQVLNGPIGTGSEEPKTHSLQLNPDRLKPKDASPPAVLANVQAPPVPPPPNAQVQAQAP